jgi:UDP-glucose 4-epimerase
MAPISLHRLAQLLIEANGGGTFAIREFPDDRRRIDIGDYYSDDHQIRELLGWQPKTSLQTALRRTLDYFSSRLPLYI